MAVALPRGQHRGRGPAAGGSISRSAAAATFLTRQFLSVVLRETGRLGLIAAAEVMLMITGEIDLSVSGTFSMAPYLMALLSVGLGVPLWLGAWRGHRARRSRSAGSTA